MATQFTQSLFSKRNLLIGGIGIAAAMYVAAKKAKAPDIPSVEVTTEEALSIFSTLAGVGGAASQIVASQRLSDVDAGTIELKHLGAPLAVTVVASAASPLLLPSRT